MGTIEVVQSSFMYGFRPTPDHNYVGLSDDGKCLVYNNPKNGDDFRLCVKNNTPDDWTALWQSSFALKPLRPNYNPTASDFLGVEKLFRTPSKKASEKLARLAYENGLVSAEEKADYTVERMFDEDSNANYAVACVTLTASEFVALAAIGSAVGIFIGKTIDYFKEDDLNEEEESDTASLDPLGW